MTTPTPWPDLVFARFLDAGVTLFAYVPDAGNKRLIELAEARAASRGDVRTVLLSTEEEGVALAAGADLVGGRAVVCMQSSGVGNIANFLSLARGARFPLLLMVSMRGSALEQNPWQKPMGEAVPAILDAMGVTRFTVEGSQELEPAAGEAVACFEDGGAAALVLSQDFLGVKEF